MKPLDYWKRDKALVDNAVKLQVRNRSLLNVYTKIFIAILIIMAKRERTAQMSVHSELDQYIVYLWAYYNENELQSHFAAHKFHENNV